jgi:molecular chaperone Hsp33
MMSDTLHRFLFERLAVRGESVHLNATWQTVLERRDYPPVIRRVLGEALAATALLSATLKVQGLLTLQLQAQGPLHLLVVQCTHSRRLRGLARWQDSVSKAPLSALCGEGTLTITFEPDDGQERYQGIVQLTGDSLAGVLETYFARSEQLPTRLYLEADDHTAAGLLLQRLPGGSADPDAWNRIEHLGDTVTAAELLGLDAQALIRRLFHEEDIRLFEADPVAFRCTCSAERVQSLLRALGREEVRSIVVEQGRVGVTCEFCGLSYDFDPVDAENLFTVPGLSGISTTRH